MTTISSHEDVAANPHQYSTTRISELLDYATIYGEFDENTPDGTTSDLGSPMCPERREAMLTYKRLLADRGVDVANLYNYED